MTMGTWPFFFTATRTLPLPAALPSETTSVMERVALAAPPSTKTTLPSGRWLTVSGGAVSAEAR